MVLCRGWGFATHNCTAADNVAVADDVTDGKHDAAAPTGKE
jgi:hypothetical protein